MEILQHTYELHRRPEAVCEFLKIKQQEVNPMRELQANLYASEFEGEKVYYVTAAGPAPYVRWLAYLLEKLNLIAASSELVFSKEAAVA